MQDRAPRSSDAGTSSGLATVEGASPSPRSFAETVWRRDWCVQSYLPVVASISWGQRSLRLSFHRRSAKSSHAELPQNVQLVRLPLSLTVLRPRAADLQSQHTPNGSEAKVHRRKPFARQRVFEICTLRLVHFEVMLAVLIYVD